MWGPRLAVLGKRPLWTPSSLPGLVHVLDASDIVRCIVKDGSNLVSQSTSLYGGSLDLSQATGANQPTWSATGLNSLYPAVTFDGTNDTLFASSAPLYAAGAASVLLVSRHPTNVANKVLVGEFSTASTTQTYTLLRNTATTDLAVSRIVADATTVDLANTPGNSASLTTAVSMHVRYDTGTTMASRLNGAAATSAAYTRSGATTLNRLSIGGAQQATPALFKAMEVALCVIATGAWSQAQQERVEGWAYWHPAYRGALTLAAGHPYLTAPPTV